MINQEVIRLIIQNVPGVKVTISGLNSIAGSETKTSYTQRMTED